MKISRMIALAGPAIFVAAVATPFASTQKPKASAKKTVSFNRDIRPILSEHCYRCHGPAAKEAKGGLRLDDPKSALKDRGYRDIFPGKPEESSIISRMTTDNEDLQMPPKDSGVHRVTKQEIALIKTWIKEGATYEKHWAFIPPTKPTIPSVKNSSWPINSIDNFILKRLETEGLKPAPVADKRTLLRRLSLTLTGLPPSPTEIDTYINDKAPGSYERAVDRYMSSKRYGEHQARYWLDAVRYSDTHGLHFDNERAVYPYRDWVVRSMNQDLPFDKFALYQLAGDLLPNPTVDMLTATAYIRMNPTTNEGGVIEAEFQAKNTFDRVDTTSTAFLGLTVGCARCHDHKYDPISQKDYYRLFAFFNSTEDKPLDGNLTAPEPSVKAITPEEAKQLKSLQADMEQAKSKVDLTVAKSWLAEHKTDLPAVDNWQVSDPVSIKSFETDFDKESEPTNWKPFKFEMNKVIPVVGRENAYAYVKATLFSKKDQNYVLQLGSDDGIKVWLNGEAVHSNKVLRGAADTADSVPVKLRSGENKLLIKIVNAGGQDGLRMILGGEVEAKIASIQPILNTPKGEAELRKLFLEAGPISELAKAYRAKKTAHDTLENSIPQCLIAKELPMARRAFVLKRGEYDMPTTPVSRDIPSNFGTLPPNAPKNRLGLARWLTDKKNPLVPRVIANRIWQQYFGSGLVKTSEDFGNQGEWPSHPELLDYLAVRFVEDGYSMKKLTRLIVTSQAFRQASIITPQKRLRDPENRLISRGPRFRLDAEVLRDEALYVSGLLVEKSGGRGFRPYQPAGLWEELAFPGSDTGIYKMDMTSDIYRRSLYLFWKRTSPHPVMSSFDAPSREACVVRRARTNTPLQSLVTMNEPAFLEAARVFSERLVKSKTNLDDRITYAYRLALGRDPSSKERQLLTRAVQRYSDRFKATPEDAKSLINVGIYPQAKDLDPTETATWMLITSTLLNLDEFLTLH